jgi:hypothetical protein
MRTVTDKAATKYLKKEQVLKIQTVTSELGGVVIETLEAEPDKMKLDPKHLFIHRMLDDNTKKL